MTEQPTWMNKEYFQSILTHHEGHDDLVVREFNVSSGSNKGENFAAAIYRVTLNYLLNDQESKKVSFILKTNPLSGAIAEMLSDMGTFEGETHIYAKVLSECEKLLPGLKIAPR
jgi:hypothetical protein